MEALGAKLALKGVVLRSGGAEGADKAFERGCDRVQGEKQTFYANDWEERKCYGTIVKWKYPQSRWEQAQAIAAQHHPSWLYLKAYTKKLHTRNCFQVLGISLQEPANFVLCWTPDGATVGEETSQATGGTGQAIRVASAHNIKVYNLARADHLEITRSWISGS
jgi:hypothetical protein